MKSSPAIEGRMTDRTRLLRVAAPRSDGILLGILEKRSPNPNLRLPPILLVHGATFGASLFDLPLPGYSLMHRLASVGRVVYALDVRGYGNSLQGKVMTARPEANPPFARSAEAVLDIGAAVDFILEREEADSLDLIGFSWGTVTGARYAGENPRHVRRLVLYAPLYRTHNADWLDRIADPKDRNRLHPGIGAYRLVTQADVTTRWDNDLASVGSALQREEGLPESAFLACLKHDPHTRANGMPAFRCPTGALADLVDIFNGRPLFDPAKLTMPVLLVRGADDTTSTDSDTRSLLSAIAATEKDYRIVAPGSHFLCLERNRSELYDRIDLFLG